MRSSLLTRALVPLLCLIGATGCAISRDALHELEAEVSQRNAERRRTAGAELLAGGYTDAEDHRLTATLGGDGVQRCLSREVGESEMTLRLTAGGGAGTGAETPDSLLTAEPEATCRFFRGGATLSARSVAAETLTLQRVSTVGLMHPPGSDAVVGVQLVGRVTTTHRPLVEMSCDHMPRVGPDPLELGAATVGVVVAPEAPERVVREFESEEVDARCTENTY